MELLCGHTTVQERDRLMRSIWMAQAEPKEHPRLQEDIETGAVVIGGGMTGVLTAHFLRQKGIETVIVEADRIGSGQTGQTTAKITLQHGLIYHRLMQRDEAAARQYAQANAHAVEEYRRMARDIDCDWADCNAWLYAQEETEPLQREYEAACRLGIDAELACPDELPFDTAAGLRFGGQARFHPLKFLRAVAQPLCIYENTPAVSVEQNRAVTPQGSVTARHIIFACHFPFVNIPGYFFARMHQERSYVIALENAASLRDMYLGVDGEKLSLRPCGNLLLFGGGGHRSGENSTGGRYGMLWAKAQEYWPHSSEAVRWSAQDCMSQDGVPFIGPFSPSRPDWYVATGFQKWGMTTAMTAAMLLSDQIAGIENPASGVFSPQRFAVAASAKKMAEDAAQSVKGLSRQVFGLPRGTVENLPIGHGGIVEVAGQKVGVYKDEQGAIHTVSARCPHLGCQLEWNPDEKSWDCPCHGSRFDFRGRRLDGPAQTDLDMQSQ